MVRTWADICAEANGAQEQLLTFLKTSGNLSFQRQPVSWILGKLHECNFQCFIILEIQDTEPNLSLVSSAQSLSHVQFFATARNAHEVSLSITNSQSLLKLISIESVMPSNHLILCHPLILLPSIFPSIRIFSNYWFYLLNISKTYTLLHSSKF